jgi:hypothetical protein
MYELELTPPRQVWERLAASLDEINADNLIAHKIQEAELIPPSAVWEKINDSFYRSEKPGAEKKGKVINLKRVAVAAVFIGLILSAWLLFFNPKQENTELVTTETTFSEDKINSDKKTESVSEPADLKTESSETNTASFSGKKNNLPGRPSDFTQTSFVQTKHEVQPAVIADKYLVSIRDEKPGDKIFDQPIDDLSMVTTDDHYLTMVNANGRMVKIPAYLAYLAPRMQDKPITEDYNEIMFGEGAFWKEKLSDWRYKLATSPVSSGDIFSNMIELLKSVQARPDDPDGRGK